MKQLLLVGAGHAHAQVLLGWAQAPLPGVALTVVSPQALAPYSGMVPGWLAGRYRFEEIVIDFRALARAAGARWVAGELNSLDAAAQRVRLASGEELPYTLLSLNVGSTLRPPALAGARVLSLRPLSALRPAWEALLHEWHTADTTAPLRVAAVGGGAAGVESVLAALAHLRRLRPDRAVSGALYSRGAELLPGLAAPARRAAERALAAAGVEMKLGVAGDATTLAGAGLALWATGAQAHGWQRDAMRRGGLAASDDGFIDIDETLRSRSHPAVFAVGDGAHWAAGPALPKAGVYAVRQGPVLLHNLRAALAGGALRAYAPQRRFLALLATADGRAIAARGPFGAHGRWAWWWKDRIDRGFIGRFNPSTHAPGGPT
ncbi:MAG: FAD-dependent oxidoreductase [Burkholderiaceae bacterium]|nr:FAD-dependent oxidoreductase [Burkholderiaceae bacterium]MCZ8175871.1 FAD-dependent oxidoreductase [Burkholderiaceae bacterium]